MTPPGPDVQDTEVDGENGDKAPPLPWHIKLLGGAFVLYVILRLIQMAGWVINWVRGS